MSLTSSSSLCSVPPLSLDDVSEIFKSFYDTFDKISANVLSTAKLFHDMLSESESKMVKLDCKALAQQVKLFEHNGDELVHDAFTKLAKKFVAPIDNQDITSLLKAPDDMLDLIEATSSRMEVYRVDSATPAMLTFSRIILNQAESVREAILALKGSRAQLAINEAAIRIDELENEADALLRDSLGELFNVSETSPAAFQVMKTKEIYEYLRRRRTRQRTSQMCCETF